MNAFSSSLTGLSLRARWLFALGLSVVIAVAVAGSWWALHPGYAALASDLRPADASEIGAALSRWGVPYRFQDGDKTLLVPAESVYQTRMKLSSEGIPKGGSVGFEAFKDSDYGVTEFAQRVNYQRALQGELERTIETMQEVRSARVHLTIHHAGLFDQDAGGSKASVTLALRDGQKLAPRQVAGIQRLVASAVESLEPGNVTLLDQGGGVLSGGGDVMAAGALGERMDEASRLQTSLRRQAEGLLARALHRKDFTVSVAVQLNYDRVKRVGSRLLAQGKDGNGLLVREKTDSSRAPGQGVDAAGTHTASGREVEYAHGSEQEEVEQAPGRVERITVGIVVPVALPPAEVARLSGVISAGIGLDPTRGDRVDLVAIASQAAPFPAAVSRPQAYHHSTPPVLLVAASAEQTQRWPTAAVAGYAVVAAVAAAFALLVMLVLRRRHPPRLAAPEREAALQSIRAWMELPERES